MPTTLEVVVAADAVDETKIKNKTRAADSNATDFSFLLIIIYPTPYLSLL